MTQRRLPPSFKNPMKNLILLAVALIATVSTLSCSALKERHIQIPAMKRVAQLGYLYNERTDSIIPVTVFRRNIGTEHITQTQNPEKGSGAAITNSIAKEFKLFGIDDNSAVNVLTGITTPRGAASSLKNGNMKPSELSGTLLFKHETVVQSLEAFHEGLKDFYNKDILGHMDATHVVTSITWGARVAVKLDAVSSMERREIRKTQHLLITALRNLRGKLSPSDEADSNFPMSIASDIPLPIEIPTTAKEVKEILNQVPALIARVNEGKGIQLQYALTPINMIRKHMGVNRQNTTAHKINEFTLGEILDAFQELHSAKDQIQEIKENINGHPNCVSLQTAATINGIISSFQNFKNNFTATLKKSVVDVRSGLQEGQVLSDLLENFRNSEFSLENLNHQFVNLSSAIEEISLCNAIQNEYSQIQYIGAGDDLIKELTTLQKSEKSVVVMFTNSEFIRDQPETYTESLNSILEKKEEGTYVCLFVNCDFSNSIFCNDLNDTLVFEYANGTFSPSFLKREIEENSRILELEANVVDIKKEVLNLQNFEIDQRQKQLDVEAHFQNAISILEQKLECVANPCLNSGKCTFKNNERHCECSAGFSGDNCETNIDDCAGHNSCLNGATCIDGTGYFSCACALGFTGIHCETNIDDCAGHNSCLNGATCIDGTGDFSCACALGFTGIHCETNIDDCAGHNSCLNGATCIDGTGDFSCACAPGFTGTHCETNIDDCAGHNSCLNGATCIDGTCDFSCACAPGFTGIHCETNIDDCAGHSSCLNGATCIDGAGYFSCACAPGFTGIHCETNIDDCAGNNSCLNGATCIDGTNSFTCVCSKEYFGNHCENQNECVYPGTCASVARNAKCRCREGYAPDPQDSRMCEPVNKNLNDNATLIFGSQVSSGGIEQFSISQNTVTRIQSHASINRALDFLYRTNSMFWSDTSGKIYTAPIRPGAPKTVVLDEPGSYIRCLAVDWIFSHVYYSDNTKDKIIVANLDGTMKKVLFATGVTDILSIVVDPLNAWMYWVDHSRKIERAGMDGSQRKVLATLPGEPHPWSLALDMTQNRLYWTMHDTHPSAIHSMKPDGTDTKLVYRAAQPTFSKSDFCSMAIFGDYVYWRDYSNKKLYKTNKCGGGEVTALHSFTDYSDAYYTLHAYHFSKQPEGVNYCENRIGGQCSHLCFPSPSTGNQAVTTKCACPDGRTLSSNQRTCT